MRFIKNQFFRIILAAIGGALMGDLMRPVFEAVTGATPVNWAVSGRWFLLALSGHPFVGDIRTEASLPYEFAVGHIAYYVVSVIFAAVYVGLLYVLARRPSNLVTGLFFGWATLVFPLFLQMPGMGFGIAGSANPAQAMMVARALVHHSSFGLGLAIGCLIVDRFAASVPKFSG